MNTDTELSLIIPVYNEAESIHTVLEEAIRILDGLPHIYEVLVIDDGSTDGTADILAGEQLEYPTLRVLTLTPNSGQSAAFGVGFKHCRAPLVILMDGDGQNDPHDIPNLLTELNAYDVCCGYRAVRRDTLSKRVGSRLANAVRRVFLDDGVKDTGCSLKGFRRSFVQDLPMELRGMHRFLPALVQMRGARLTQIPVNHRVRACGVSKYTNWCRLKETVADLLAVRWMQKRYRNYAASEIQGVAPCASTMQRQRKAT